MKKINTGFAIEKDADIVEIKNIIKNLFSKTSEDFVLLYSDDNNDYIQATGGLEYEEDGVEDYLLENFSLAKDEVNKLDRLYIVEYRKYDEADNFRHYRGYFPDENMVCRFFEDFFNDQEIDTGKWLDVTDQF